MSRVAKKPVVTDVKRPIYRRASGLDRNLVSFVVTTANMKDRKNTDTQTAGWDKPIDD